MFSNINFNRPKILKWTAILSIPYVLLLLLQLINPFIATAKYCPRPTLLEDTIWIFPSPVTEWSFYALGVLFIYFVVFLFRGIYKVLTRPSQVGVDGEMINQPSALRVMAPVLLTILALVGLTLVWSIFDTVLVHSRYGFVYNFMRAVENVLIPLIFFATIIFLFLGAFLYLIPGLDGNNVARRKGRIYMSTALLMGFVMVLIWGTVNLVAGGLGIEGGTVNIPELPSSGGGAAFGGASSFGTRGMSDGVAQNTIGFSVGGAKDIDNFRENIEQCYLPIPTDVTYEGLFYDYTFDTENRTGCTELFCPQYEAAVVADPFSKQDEYFLSVGLASNIDAATFARPPLDVVVVLDISGSMGSPFDRYFYDQFRLPGTKPDSREDWNTSKMEIAKEALGAMADRLHPDDRFGLVVFDSTAETRLEPFTMGQNGYATAKNAIYALAPRGGTNMGAGLLEGTKLLKSIEQEEGVDRERRIIFLTDAMPNTGPVEQNELYVIGKENATEGIHTTFIGVGVDFNTELIEALTKEIPGANYYAIHSNTDFEKRLDTEFEYMVAPLVYDLSLTVEGGDYKIRTVYGSPEAHLATGEIMHVSTLFPSPSSEGSSRGGIILVHMNRVRDSGEPTKVTASYVDRAGEQHSAEGVVPWSGVTGESASTNVRKAALLSRYVNLLQNWLLDENARQGKYEKTVYTPIQYYNIYRDGLVIPVERYPVGEGMYSKRELNYWERLSRELVVSEDYKDLFKDFRLYAEDEMKVFSDKEQKALQYEIELLKNLENSPDSDYEPEEDVGIERVR